MRSYENIKVEKQPSVLSITLDRPSKRNAINEQTMDELLHVLSSIQEADTFRMAVLRGNGDDFSAGADLQWMRTTQQMGTDELQQQNMKLQKVFELWFDLPVFTLAILQGNVVGGAIGLAAASDMVVCHPNARFRFSEVTLGLMPATISPFVWQRTQSRFIRNAMLTAEPFDALMAVQYGLADRISEHPEDIINKQLAMLEKAEPHAVAKTKKLWNDLTFHRIEQPLDLYTTRLLAQVRKSEAASKRIAAFFQTSQQKP